MYSVRGTSGSCPFGRSTRRPVLARAQGFYVARAKPAMDTTVVTLYKWQRASAPYVARAAEKSKELAPYLRMMVERLAVLLEFLAAQRRTFVDPHVSRIWDKVVELSSSSPSEALKHPSPDYVTHTSKVAEPEAGAEAEAVRESLMPEDTPEAVPLASLVFDPAAPEDIQTASVPHGATPSAVEHEEPTQAAADEATQSSYYASPSYSAVPTPTSIVAAAQEAEDLDLDAFYAELGLSESSTPEPTTSSSSARPPLSERTATSVPEPQGPTREEAARAPRCLGGPTAGPNQRILLVSAPRVVHAARAGERGAERGSTQRAQRSAALSMRSSAMRSAMLVAHASISRVL